MSTPAEIQANMARYIELSAAQMKDLQGQLEVANQKLAADETARKTAAATAVDTLIGHGLIKSAQRDSAIAELVDPVKAIGRLQKMALTRTPSPDVAPPSIGTVVSTEEPTTQKRASETAPRDRDIAFYQTFGLPAHLAKRPNA